MSYTKNGNSQDHLPIKNNKRLVKSWKATPYDVSNWIDLNSIELSNIKTLKELESLGRTFND